jgi:rhodanese-related sulfurtransferase
VIIVDARPQKTYEESHLDGALNIPSYSIFSAATAKQFMNECNTGLPKDNKDVPIIVHCAIGGEANSTAKALKGEGYTDIVNAGSIGRVKKLAQVGPA